MKNFALLFTAPEDLDMNTLIPQLGTVNHSAQAARVP